LFNQIEFRVISRWSFASGSIDNNLSAWLDIEQPYERWDIAVWLRHNVTGCAPVNIYSRKAGWIVVQRIKYRDQGLVNAFVSSDPIRRSAALSRKDYLMSVRHLLGR